ARMEGAARARGRRESPLGVLPGAFRRRRARHPQAVGGIRRPLRRTQTCAGPRLGPRDLPAAAERQGHRRLRGRPRPADGRAVPREGPRAARGGRAHAPAADRSRQRRRPVRAAPRRARPAGRARRDPAGVPARARAGRAARLRDAEPSHAHGRRAHLLARPAAPAPDPAGALQVLSRGRGLHRGRDPHLRAHGEPFARGCARRTDPRQREALEQDTLRRPRLRRDRLRPGEVRVHQFHPVLAPGDAMSNHVFALRKKIRHWGFESFAYAVETKPGVVDVRSYRRMFRDVHPGDLVIVHFSMGSEVIDQILKIPARRVLVYHNITPPEFFGGINPHAAAFARLGLGGAVAFAGGVDDPALLAYYRAASCFISLSEHEGFGVPLLEAMRFRLPVVAYDAAAVGETVDSAAILLRERDLAEAA